MIKLSAPIHVISNNILNLHGHQTHRSQDIITSYLIISIYFCKNMACFIFLIKTRLTQESKKIGITPFGSV